MNLFGNKTNSVKPSEGPPAETTAQHKKILIVEDEAVLADALEITLKGEGFEVFKAVNGQLGLEMALANKPNIVLLDLLMPVMDGKTMLHKLREIPEFKTLPVVVLTNAGDADNMRETKFYDNASAFLIKSNVTPGDIANQVKTLIN
jgi:DNA-binding response OmpR family regulator